MLVFVHSACTQILREMLPRAVNLFKQLTTLSRKKVHACCNISMMLHVSALQSQVVKSRQLFRRNIHTLIHHLRTVWAEKHCQRMASPNIWETL